MFHHLVTWYVWGKRVGRGYHCVAPSYRPTHHLPKSAQGLPWAPIFLTLASEHEFFWVNLCFKKNLWDRRFLLVFCQPRKAEREQINAPREIHGFKMWDIYPHCSCRKVLPSIQELPSVGLGWTLLPSSSPLVASESAQPGNQSSLTESQRSCYWSKCCWHVCIHRCIWTYANTFLSPSTLHSVSLNSMIRSAAHLFFKPLL